MKKKEWIKEPYRRCGKTPRYDYDGCCMGCVDFLDSLRSFRGAFWAVFSRSPLGNSVSAQNISETI